MGADGTQGDTEGASSPSWIDERLAAERARLLRQAGLPPTPAHHFRRPTERPFTRHERGHATILFGGLTLRHNQLIQAGVEGLGYKANLIPVPTRTDFQTGKEYGNNGQCNPTYFTVGALVNHLRQLRDEEGIPTEKILSDYLFVTAGTCGPCRFGMYEAEYRLALRNAGFDGFRVILFDQEGGLAQSSTEAGLELSLPFFLSFLNAALMGDLLNAIANQIRPYETEPGKTNEVFKKCLAICQDALRSKDYAIVRSRALAKLLAKATPVSDPDHAAKFLDQLRSPHYIEALGQCREIIEAEIEVDYTRPKPITKITGEFWAQTTEGEGNFNMFPFLESEGSEIQVEPLATWISYMLGLASVKARDRRGLNEDARPPGFWNFRKRFQLEKNYRGQMFTLTLADKILAREYERMRIALGGTAHPLVNQLELQRVGHPYYNVRLEGGEGFLEVAKNIYYFNHDLAHMVLSLKPFGCMPSTQSDGAQAAVISHYPEMIYLPVETSGEGEINARSRVQMALGDAKVKCKDEFKAAVARTGYALADIRRYAGDRRELRRPLQCIPHADGVIGHAANFVLHVAHLMDRDPAWAARKIRPSTAGA